MNGDSLGYCGFFGQGKAVHNSGVGGKVPAQARGGGVPRLDGVGAAGGAPQQRGAHGVFVADDGEQPPAGAELVDEGVGHGEYGARKENGIKGAVFERDFEAVSSADVDVECAGARQVFLGALRQRFVQLGADDALRQATEQGGHEAGAGADVQHFFVRGDVQLLRHARLHTWGQHDLTSVAGSGSVSE